MGELTRTSDVRDAWIEWLDHCNSGVYVNQKFFGKTIGGVPDPWAEAIQALEQTIASTDYGVPRSAWAYNFRGIGGAACSCGSYGRCSLHGSGVAVDIDPRLNRFTVGSPWDGKFTEEQILLIEGIKNTYGEQMWTWGGRWSKPDRMHFQARVAPDRAQVDWSTVPDGVPPQEDEQTMKRGDSGQGVADAQRGAIENHDADLGDWPAFNEDYPVGADGDFGGTFEGWVMGFQTQRGLVANGIVDGLTAALIVDGRGTSGGSGAHDHDDEYAEKDHGHKTVGTTVAATGGN